MLLPFPFPLSFSSLHFSSSLSVFKSLSKCLKIKSFPQSYTSQVSLKKVYAPLNHLYIFVPDDDLDDLVELVSLEAEGVEDPGERSLTVVGEYHDLKTSCKQNLEKNNNCIIYSNLFFPPQFRYEKSPFCLHNMNFVGIRRYKIR